MREAEAGGVSGMWSDVMTQQYELKRDDARPLRFLGDLIAEADTRDPERNKTRWYQYRLFLTQGGTFVVQRVGRTLWQGERDRYEAAAFKTGREVVEFLGLDDGAKDLYRQASIDIAEDIE